MLRHWMRLHVRIMNLNHDSYTDYQLSFVCYELILPFLSFFRAVQSSWQWYRIQSSVLFLCRGDAEECTSFHSWRQDHGQSGKASIFIRWFSGGFRGRPSRRQPNGHGWRHRTGPTGGPSPSPARPFWNRGNSTLLVQFWTFTFEYVILLLCTYVFFQVALFFIDSIFVSTGYSVSFYRFFCSNGRAAFGSLRSLLTVSSPQSLKSDAFYRNHRFNLWKLWKIPPKLKECEKLM